MQWLRCSEDGTCPREEMPGAALEALAVEAVVLQLVGLMDVVCVCLLYTSPSPRDVEESRMPSSA